MLRRRPLSQSLARRTWWLPASGAAVFAVLTVQVVHHDGIVRFDLHVRSWVAAHQVHALNQALLVLTDVVSPPVEIVAVLFYFWRWHRRQLRNAAVTTLGTQAVVIAVKAAVARPTPIHQSLFYGDYPSGHTAMLLTCAGTVLLLNRFDAVQARRLWIATAAATAVTMAALIYVQGHWFSDTVASVALATVALWGLAVTATDR